MTRRRSREGQGDRTRSGERISPWAPDPIDRYIRVKCPTCFRPGWQHELTGNALAEGTPGFEAYWQCEPLEVSLVVKWPRNPHTGARGFFYQQFGDVPDDVVNELYWRLARRQAHWQAMIERRWGVTYGQLLEEAAE